MVCFPSMTVPDSELAAKFRLGNAVPPPYIPDLAPSDFHLFPAFKKHLSGHRQTCYLYVADAAETYNQCVLDGQSYAVISASTFKGTMLKYNVQLPSLLCIGSSLY
jgi:hypothetical protein